MGFNPGPGDYFFRAKISIEMSRSPCWGILSVFKSDLDMFQKSLLFKSFFNWDLYRHLVGQHSTMVSILASRPSCPTFNSQCTPKNFRGKNYWCSWGLLTALLWAKWTVAWKCWLNPPSGETCTKKVLPSKDLFLHDGLNNFHWKLIYPFNI